MKKILGVLFLLVIGLGRAAPALAQRPTPAPAVLTITVLGKDGQPLAGIRLVLELVRYGDAVEYVDAGSCTTDRAGQCAFELADVPRLRDGSAEALLTVGDFGRQPLGWKGEDADFVIQASDVGLAATLRAPLDNVYEGQTEAPTDAPPPTLAPTRTPTPVPPATETPLSTEIPRPSPTPTPEPPPPAPAPSLPGILPILLALIGAGSLWVGIVLVLRARRRK